MDIGEHIYTLDDVVAEIRDKATRQRLQCLPYELKFETPTPEDYKFVCNFAKKTGDYPCLSATDLKVLAVTYRLAKEHIGIEHIKTEPEKNVIITRDNITASEANNIVGFYMPNKGKGKKTNIQRNGNEDEDVGWTQQKRRRKKKEQPVEDSNVMCRKLVEVKIEDESNQVQLVESSSQTLEHSLEDTGPSDVDSDQLEPDATDSETYFTSPEDTDGDTDTYYESEDLEATLVAADTSITEFEEDALMNSTKIDETAHESSGVESDVGLSPEHTNGCTENGNVQGGDQEDEGLSTTSDVEESSDDEDSWITPSNIDMAKLHIRGASTAQEKVIVACMTTDFSMQNVLRHMGLEIIGLDGMVIKKVRTFILRCYICAKTTTEMTKAFCPSCGHKTLKRVAVTLKENGEQVIHISRKPLNLRGTKFSLPTPRGGKHVNNPIVCEDQPRPQQRLPKKAMLRTNALDPDYPAGSSPFATNDVYSKAFHLGRRKGKGGGRQRQKNPNVVGPKRR